jgi:hypothetical protein
MIGRIQAFHDALASVGIRAWLQGGALLGLMRDGDLIAWDKDVDFGVMHDDWHSDGAVALEHAGFAFSREFSEPGGHYQSRWVRDGVEFDLFHHYRRNDTVYCAVWGPQGPFAVAWPTFTLEPLRVGGVNVLAPRDPIGYLEHQYGDWRTPRPDWVYYRDQLNMEAL